MLKICAGLIAICMLLTPCVSHANDRVDALIRHLCGGLSDGSSSRMADCEKAQQDGFGIVNYYFKNETRQPGKMAVYRGCMDKYGFDAGLDYAKWSQCIMASKPVIQHRKKQATISHPNATVLINQRCARTWGDDFRMQKFCRKQQNSALASLRLWEHSSNSSVDLKIKKLCTDKWHDDFKMVVFCLKQQIDSYNNL